MRKEFCITVIFVLLSILSANAADDRFVLVIDPGHGGRDAGAVRGNYKEKTINLGVALALGRLIEANMKDVKVVYTRKSDTFVDLYKRAEIANKAKANLFVSIHTNSTASRTTTAQGADTYILGLARSEENLAVAKRENSVILLEDNYKKRYEGFDPNSPESYIIFEFMTDKYMEQSLDFATHVQRGFTHVARRKDRGVRQAGFLILRESAMPSVLIELGFINNPTEAKYLASSTGQRSMASAIYSGIEKYVRDFNRKRGRISSPSNTSGQQSATAASKEATTAPVTREGVEASRKSSSNTNTASNTGERQQPVSPTSAETAPVVTRERDVAVNEAGTAASGVSAGKIEYRVQFLISQRKLPAKSAAFKGLSPVKEYIDKGTYKYTYGSADNEVEALRIRNEVRKLFKDAFVVEFKDGVRIK